MCNLRHIYQFLGILTDSLYETIKLNILLLFGMYYTKSLIL